MEPSEVTHQKDLFGVYKMIRQPKQQLHDIRQEERRRSPSSFLQNEEGEEEGKWEEGW